MNQTVSGKLPSTATSMLIGGGSILGSVATGVSHSPGLADAFAMRRDLNAIAWDLWGSMAAIDVDREAVHPGQERLFGQEQA